MSRFSKQTSKYKNAVTNVHKKERWINDLKVGSNLRPTGNHIKASSSHVAFVHDSTSVGALAVLPINAGGRFSGFPMIAGHSACVTDFDFSPFDERLLATGSEDCTVKLWNLPSETELRNDLRLTSSLVNLGPYKSRIENLIFHPSANNVLAISSGASVEVFDIGQQTKCLELSQHEDVVESISWHGGGHLMLTVCKSGAEKSLKVFDPRASSTCVSEKKYHNGQKHARALFLHDTDKLITAGFNKMREAELVLWSSSNLASPLCRQSLGTSSSGSPSLLYDTDSKMVFAALKSESTISHFDCSVSLVPGQQAYHGSVQTKGIAMVPKLNMDVMSCEFVRLLQLTQNAIIPVSYHVPRKSHSEFHADLYPDTLGDVPAMTSAQWLSGENIQCEKVSLDPKKRKPKVVQKEKEEVVQKSPAVKVDIKQAPPIVVDTQQAPPNVVETSKVSDAAKSINVVRSSKFRHIQGKFRHRSTFINKLPSLSSTVPGDSNAFQANRDRVAAVLSSPGGQLGVFELNKTGRLDSGAVPTLQNGSAVTTFTFDPFNAHKIVVACEDAKLRLWTIPENGLTETLTEPEYLIGHQEKVNVLQFHPQAKSLLASSGYDGKLLLWNISSLSISLSLDRLSEPLFCMAWSPDGTQLATVAKDHIIRIYEPRSTVSPLGEMNGPEGSRGARVVWLENCVIAVSGFNKASMRTVSLFDTSSSSVLSEIVTTISPATLVPHYDVDTKLLFLSGKGDNSIIAYEYVKAEPPYLFAVAPFSCGSAHQAVAFLPKTLCDVAKVEIAVGVRLTTNSVEGFTFQVPRTRVSYFQDDIYPCTTCVEEAALSADEWLHGKDALQRKLSLQPSNMKALSEAPKEPPAAKKFSSFNSQEYKTDQQKKEELMSAMIDKMGDKDDDPLPQQTMDGADSDEWSD